MITPAQLKAHARNKAKETGIQPQSLIHLFMMERFIVRVSHSAYRHSFILKGGFLIGSLIGVGNRTTVDLDATITGLTVDEDTMTKMLKEICTESHEDGIEFSLNKLTPIREEEDYPGFRASLIANLSTMRIPFKLDIGTGDAITPKEIRHTHSSMFSKIAMLADEEIQIMSYPVQTVLAEKVETILRRGLLNTRTRDFYDVYMIMRLFDNDLSDKECAEALMNTMKNRKSTAFFKNYKEIIEELKNDTTKQSDWNRYQKQFSYAEGIYFNDTLKECLNFCDAVVPHFEV